VVVGLELGQAVKVDKLLENEPDVTKRRDIVSHNPRLSQATRKSAARSCPGGQARGVRRRESWPGVRRLARHRSVRAPDYLALMRPKALARLTASSRLWTPSLLYRRAARSLAADREMPSLSAITEKGSGVGRYRRT